METLTEVHEQMFKELGSPDFLSPTNIDDVLWYAKARGVKKLQVLPAQLNCIWQFIVANIGENDTEMRRLYFIEGKAPRVLGIDLVLQPYKYVDTTP